MKMKKSVLLYILLGFSSASLTAQDFQDLLRAGASDGSQYLQKYMEPAMISFANGLAGGWMNTAKNHKLLGIDITASVNFATIPTDLQNFTFRNADYEAFTLDGSASEGQLPTFGGGAAQNSLYIPANLTVDIGDGQTYTFTERVDIGAIDGVGADLPFTAAPAPTLQLGIGLMKNTDVKIRYIPTVTSGDFQLDLFGIGIMHDIKQWIPGLKLVPIDLVGFIGTTKLTTSIGIDDVNDPDFSISNAATEMSVTATTVQFLVSKKLAVFTPYAGIGYNFTKSSIDVKGVYTFKDQINPSNDQTITDPIALSFDGGNSPRMTIGAQLKLLVLTFHADYTVQKYNTFTAGVGISVR